MTLEEEERRKERKKERKKEGGGWNKEKEKGTSTRASKPDRLSLLQLKLRKCVGEGGGEVAELVRFTGKK